MPARDPRTHPDFFELSLDLGDQVGITRDVMRLEMFDHVPRGDPCIDDFLQGAEIKTTPLKILKIGVFGDLCSQPRFVDLGFLVPAWV